MHYPGSCLLYIAASMAADAPVNYQLLAHSRAEHIYLPNNAHAHIRKSRSQMQAQSARLLGVAERVAAAAAAADDQRLIQRVTRVLTRIAHVVWNVRPARAALRPPPRGLRSPAHARPA